MRISDIGEIGLIKRLSRGISLDRSVIKGIGDDAAVVEWDKSRYLLLTSDMLIEGEHFTLKSATPYQIGWKALGRTVSDIAAMGGVSRHALVSIALNPGMKASFVDGIYRGMKGIARMFGVNIVGGDTARSGRIVIDVSMAGEVEKGRLVLRSGAKPGDRILVTGKIGGASKRKHLEFIPRQREARFITGSYRVNSMIDISDGLAIDLWRILRSSGVGGRIHEGAVPLAGQAGSVTRALRGGEDYELLFTMGAREAGRFLKTGASRMKTPVTAIGEITDKPRRLFLARVRGGEKALEPKGYLHF